MLRFVGMKFYHYSLLVAVLACFAFSVAQHPIHREWKLVAEEITYLNHDYSKSDYRSARLDSVRNEVVRFLPDGVFQSSEGDGIYEITKDSIHIAMNNKKRSFKYTLHNSKLMMESHDKEKEYVLRSRLYLE